MYSKVFVAPLMLFLLLQPALASDEYNIDFGDLSFGILASYGAAAAQPGEWNIIDTLGTVPLLDTASNANGVTLSINVASGFGSDGNYPGPHADLLDDMLWGLSASAGSPSWSLTFIGLPEGLYNVYYYAPAHPMPTGDLLINNIPAPSLPGDSLDTSLVKGVNWGVLGGVVTTGGILRISATNTEPSEWLGVGGIAGIQLAKRNLIPIDPPPPGC